MTTPTIQAIAQSLGFTCQKTPPGFWVLTRMGLVVTLGSTSSSPGELSPHHAELLLKDSLKHMADTTPL